MTQVTQLLGEDRERLSDSEFSSFPTELWKKMSPHTTTPRLRMSRIRLGLREQRGFIAAVAGQPRQLLLAGAPAQPGFEHAQCAPGPSHWYRPGAQAPGFSGDRRLVQGGARGGSSSGVPCALSEFPRH